MPPFAFDWSTFFVLGLVTLTEGVRRTPAGSYLVRRTPGDRWRVANGPTSSSGWRLVSYWSPLSLHCVVSSQRSFPRPAALAPSVLRWVGTLRIFGGLVIIGLLVGIPVMTPMFGTWGFLLAVLWVFTGASLTAIATVLAFRDQGLETRAACRKSLGLLWPFAAPRAPELVLEFTLEGYHPLEAIKLLLPPDAYYAYIRPYVYDALMSGSIAEALPECLDTAMCESIIRQPPVKLQAGERYCPRCGGTYVSNAIICVSCHVSLIEQHGSLAQDVSHVLAPDTA